MTVPYVHLRSLGSGQLRSFGFSLVELMVAITISAILIFGATQVYVDSRRTHDITESTARLQETARYAMGALEADIRMANYWGLVKGANTISGQATQAAASAGAPTSCGTNFARDLMANIDGSNNSYARNSTLTFGCAAYGAGAVTTSDTLTVRRASTTPSTVTTGRLQICSNRINGVLVTDSSACAGAPQGQVNDLIVHAYYVSRDSTQAAGLPSLRRKTLTTDAGSPAFRDDEIIPGIEDMQLQFGLDPSGTNGTATRYVDPGSIPAASQIVSVRMWLLVRAENPEVGFTDSRTYTYGDRPAYTPNDGFRRLLISRTFQIRNAIGT